MSHPQIVEREAAAQKIKSSPDNYKVCECCGSIVVAKSAVCPNCSAYRFDTTHQAVINQAEFLATRAPLSIESKDYI